MINRRYYSIRTGKNPDAIQFDLSILLRLFNDLYKSFDIKYYFQEAFGYNCVDAGDVPGTLGSDIEAQLFRKLRKPNLWPISEICNDYSEDDVFDVIEFLYDRVSKPIDGYYHDYSGCGWHYQTFNIELGRQEWKNEINDILRKCRYFKI